MALLKEKALERLSDAWSAGRLAHAYLLIGQAGSGRRWLAEQLAALVLGTDPATVAAHPDFHHVAPESKSRKIVIEQMREMDQALQMTPMCGNTKTAIIQDADRLQPQAANAFLKTLEEPPPGCHIFLITQLPDAVLETIVSRCIAVPLRSNRPPVPGADPTDLAAALSDALLQTGGPDAAAAMRFTRVFQKTLAALRERVTGELGDELKRELKHYRDSASTKWEEDRENQIKAQAESAVVQEREILLAAAGEVLAAGLRFHHLPDETCPENIRRIAAANPAPLLLRRLQALERTRDLLSRNVQEALALETGFLEMIAHT